MIVSLRAFADSKVSFTASAPDVVAVGDQFLSLIHIYLALVARSYDFIKRRGYVIPEDERAVAHDVLRHLIGLSYEAEASNMTSDEIVSKILNVYRQYRHFLSRGQPVFDLHNN